MDNFNDNLVKEREEITTKIFRKNTLKKLYKLGDTASIKNWINRLNTKKLTWKEKKIHSKGRNIKGKRDFT